MPKNSLMGKQDTDARPSGAMQHRQQVEESILDATCGGRSILLPGQKEHDQTLYVDNRELESTGQEGRTYSVQPDEIQDFRDLEYADEQFDLVVFDPPHVIRPNGQEDLKGYVTKAYGALHAETWRRDLRLGFKELFRTLKTGGVLVFKFADNAVDFDEVLKLAPEEPLFGTTSKKNNVETRWFVFYKEGSR